MAEGGEDLLGHRVTVSGDVYRRIGEGFTLGRELENAVLVLPAGSTSAPVREEMVVQVTGTVRAATVEEMEGRLGDAAPTDRFRAFVDEPVIVTTQVSLVTGAPAESS